ncbi:SIMPL domain-containing protein [Loktanella sp. IMCC34160]|uniref:SIMPL domain-containing protein n=1 Tax=Loktanella sp. IMCC34160 TaxID=2510646 RepID=UPI0013EBE213|nr:SIMPL domain-containing protein [Loktanella sp. IMCC34160]
MRRLMIVTLATLSLLVGPAAWADDGGPLRSIDISGQGEVSVPPDMATVTLGVRVEAETEAATMDEASARTAAVLEGLAAKGVAAADVQSGSIRLTPRYGQNLLGGTDYSNIVGFTATNTITAKIRDINAVGEVLSATVGDGANMVQGIRFGLQDEDSVRDEARRRAVAEAMRLAALYADAAGMELGTVVRITDGSISDGGGYGAMAAPVMEMASSRSAPQMAVPVAPGEITIYSSISMVFELSEAN